MQVQNSVKPENKFEIQNISDNKCNVIFYDNITEEQSEDEKVIYTYNIYNLEVEYRNGLSDSIESNFEKWLEAAKKEDYNNVANEVRKQRDKLLAETDWTQMADTALATSDKEKYKIYRQALRDIPEQEGFPYDVVFPAKPTVW